TAKSGGWRGEVVRKLLGKLPDPKYTNLVATLLRWMIVHKTDGDLGTFGLDGYETVLASLPPDKLTAKGQWGNYGFRELANDFGFLIGALRQVAIIRKVWTPEHVGRLYALKRWLDEPVVPAGKAKGKPRKIVRDRPGWDEVVDAFGAGFANEHDLYDHLLGPRPGEDDEDGSVSTGFYDLREASQELLQGELSDRVAAVVRRAIDRVLEIELARGEMETVVTPAAQILHYAGGLDVLVRVLVAIGRDPKLRRTYAWGAASKGKSVVFSHLIKTTVPGKTETPEAFVRAVREAEIPEDTLLAVAFYAPQWARFVHAAVGWPLLDEAVLWFHAHTKDSSWRHDSDEPESGQAEIRKLTPLAPEDLVEGAVDVDWFHRVHEALGETRWSRLDEFAKYASGGAGHKRAQLFADAMLGKVKKADLVKDIRDKRKQDAVRALGLLPLDKKKPKEDVHERYGVIQEFLRGTRAFGSQKQASEKLAARIGQENLARTAGYPDPIRLQWAMEGLASADLAKGPVVVQVKDVTVQLSIEADGLPEISVTRGEKPLKSIPPDVKKHANVQELLERKTDLRRSASRMRQSLELAMCRGDVFGRDELLELANNAVLRPMLERLVFVGEGIAGYPVQGGKGLRTHTGQVEPVKKDETLRLAHPVDLLASGDWSQWQHDCFHAERVQPFKQVFRE
ncbi:MAG: DUF4132 domain-containing protein, partial [Acidimicrobiales bacterium]|nr:DUF4132 domain-containing protein [Acidimicrobiales bacterium]